MGGALLSRGLRPGTEPPRGTPASAVPTPTHRRPLLTPHLPATEDRKQVKKERPCLSYSIISSHTYCLRATPVSCVFIVFFLKCPDTQTPHSNHHHREQIPHFPAPLCSAVGTLQVFVKDTSYQGGVTHLGVFHPGSHSARMALQGAPGSHRP